MPQAVNSKSDIGNARRFSDSYDVDNVFLTDEGWVYRHFKGNGKFWDEIIVAGQSTSLNSVSDAAPTFESGDTKFDFEYKSGGFVPLEGTKYTAYPQYPAEPVSEVPPGGNGDGGAGAPASVTATYVVSVVAVGESNKYSIGGVTQKSITATAGDTIVFDQTDGSNDGHPIGIYLTSNKGGEISNGVTTNNGIVTFVTSTSGNFHYQCQIHAGMGGTITVN